MEVVKKLNVHFVFKFHFGRSKLYEAFCHHSVYLTHIEQEKLETTPQEDYLTACYKCNRQKLVQSKIGNSALHLGTLVVDLPISASIY